MQTYSSYSRHAAQRQVTPRSEVPPAAPPVAAQPAQSGDVQRRGMITRVNRACNGCRRAKIRCIGAESPPCERCRMAEQECVVEKPLKAAAVASDPGVDERLQSLEGQVASLRSLLQQVVDSVCPDIGATPEAKASFSSPAHTSSPSDPRAYRAPRFWHPSPKHVRVLEPSAGPSRGVSEGPDDVLGMEGMANPLEVMSSIATRMERRVEADDGAEDDTRPFKRARVEDPGVEDVISKGLIKADEAATLVDVFYSGSSDFINCYDPERDHFLALRKRSTFSLTAVMMVGARVRDSGGPPSAAHKICLEATRAMAKETLISTTSSVEDVKAMILLAAFSENGWLISGHAVRMAIDLGLNLAFNRLLESGMGSAVAPQDEKVERHLVEQARVWFAVYRLEHQMSYGLGRPAIVREDATIHNARLLLDHPLALDADARLIYAVELLALRGPLHVELTATPDLPLDSEILARLRWASEQLNEWERHWDDVLCQRYGKEHTGFVHESLSMQRQLAELFINSQLLRGVHSVADVEAMSEEKRRLALRAMHNALRCVDICLRGQYYAAGLPYGTHYTHVCAAYAASFLIRIARFFPGELDHEAVAQDVEDVASALSKVPAGRYARSLRLILRKARRENIFPPPRPENDQRRLSAAGSLPTNPPEPTTWYDGLNLHPGLGHPGAALARMGYGKDAPVPLFLNGNLGTSIGPSDAVPFVGLEDFFMPAELDDLFASLENGGQ